MTGRLTDEVTGRPLAKGSASVSLLVPGQWQPPALIGDDGRYTLTAATGTWRLAVGAPDPDYPFAYLGRGPDGPTPDTQAPTVVVQEGVTSTVDMTMTPAGRVEGRVVSADGDPVTPAEVYLRNANGDVLSMPNAAPTDRDGRFTVYAVGVPIAARIRVKVFAGNDGAYSDWFTIGPKQVVTGVSVTMPAATPTPTATGTATGACTSECGGGGSLPATGVPGAGAGAVVLAVLLSGAGALMLARPRPPGRH